MNIKERNNLIVFAAIVILSIIPSLYTWGNLAIGGDMMIPFESSSLKKYLYQWVEVQQGSYFALNFFPFYLVYEFLSFLGFKSIYQISAILLFLINFLGGLGIYKLCKLFFRDEKAYLYVLPVALFLLSPAHLNAWQYLSIYSIIPWLVYFAFKILIKKEINVSDMLWISVLLFFGSLELPNPKYIFYFIVVFGICIIAGFFLKIIDTKFFLKNRLKLLIFIFLVSYLFVPQIVFVLNYSPKNYGVHVKDNYKDSGDMMGEGVTTISNLLRAYHDNTVLRPNDRNQFNNSILVKFSGYIAIILLVINLFFLKQNKGRDKYPKEEMILYILILFFLFLASSSNPPFGSIYRFLVTNFSTLGFLRTSAGANFFLAAFYAIAIFLFLVKLKRFQVHLSLLVLGIIVVLGFPILNGDYFKNNSPVNQYINTNEAGVKVPNEYFDIKNFIDSQKIEARTFHPKAQLSYINLKWGFFGPVLYNFLYSSYNIGYEKIFSREQDYNIGFVFIDKSSLDIEHWKSILPTVRQVSNELIDFKIVDFNTVFLQRFYTPKNTLVSSMPMDNLPRFVSQENFDIRSAVFLVEQNIGKENALNELKDINQSITFEQDSLPVLEFKKINPTKYRVRAHASKGKFPLVFSESFHSQWKMYLTKLPSSTINGVIEKYQILNGNEEAQASKEELVEYINRGWVTTLGNGQEKEIRHQVWNSEKQEERVGYTEKHSVDFVSKNFQGTVQNDNLPDGRLWETWFKKPLSDNVNHLMVNGYANAWIIDVKDICESHLNLNTCRRNPDGTYDFEAVIEFFPQRIFLFSSFVSSLALILCLGWVIILHRKRKDVA